MALKKYQSINYVRFVTSVIIDDIEYEIIFSGGQLYPIRRNGYFTTEETKIQKALEERDDFGISFILTETIKKDKKCDTSQPTFIYEVKNRQEAIEWLRINKGAIFENNRNIKEIQAVALNYDLYFPNLDNI